MADKQKKEVRRSPLVMQVVKGAFFLLVGFMLIVQPWLKAVSWIGWIIVALSLLIGCATVMRLINAQKMQKQLVAQFANGDAVYAQGLRIDGALYDFSTFGAQIDAVSFDGEKLSFSYSFFARRGGRTGEVVSILVGAEEADKAQLVLEKLSLPTLEAFEEKQKALEAARKAEDAKENEKE